MFRIKIRKGFQISLYVISHNEKYFFEIFKINNMTIFSMWKTKLDDNNY